MSNRTIHELKIQSVHFADVLAHRKTHEVRINDRDYQTGDCLHLREIDLNGEYTGQEANAEVSHVLHGGQFGIAEGWCVLSLKSGTSKSALNLICFLRDRLQETCDCIDASHDIIKQSGHTTADAERTANDARAFIDMANEFLSTLGEGSK
ncbi:DUF3850 domain-containing protein [Vibrio neptunius]|uniref:DUF3850 domain-containing protein n=1 Tax=Vibrio neptunius TaxID=170651 RepID=A0ABS2ZXS8_9VIBR|nr:DUF3850 domain-containing protein [Vibrio neptunius]MBN3492044.1 DUF3850 domain-containing protein [Vibrio neptunius]MBN3514541.1 DUF3850 domain-containing protein [Vibrio neptunius]MBN3549333.1 DUF3850 domain-containing protein [Vibrio neptunius]MBN3576858.1 DUF3850 domain-containing protein [Vibrio neptunius]MCH9870522.1 DUF3850 domain-containing protein [Vibrio neptunius]